MVALPGGLPTALHHQTCQTCIEFYMIHCSSRESDHVGKRTTHSAERGKSPGVAFFPLIYIYLLLADFFTALFVLRDFLNVATLVPSELIYCFQNFY